MSAIIVIVDTKSIQKKNCKKYPSTTIEFIIISAPKIIKHAKERP
jgi:hypothetical protein